MESGYYISNGKKIILSPDLEKLDLSIDQSNHITTIKCNINLKKLFLAGENLTPFDEIDIEFNENLKFLKIEKFSIKSLILNKKLEKLELNIDESHKMTGIKCNENLKKLHLHGTPYINKCNLTPEIEFNKKLKSLRVSNLSLKSLITNKNLMDFSIKTSQIEHLVLNGKFKSLKFQYNKIDTLEVRASDLKKLSVPHNELKKIILNEKLEKLNVKYNALKEIELNENLKTLYVQRNKIKTIILNENLEELNVCHNNVAEIELNENLKTLDISYNKLKKIILIEKLEELDVSYNKLTDIELNENLRKLDVSDNNLEKIILTKKLKELSISNRKNKNIKFDNSIGNSKVKIEYSAVPN